MRKITDIKGEEALDVLADIIEPVAEIMTDDKIQELVKEKNKLRLITVVLKEHKESIIEILSVIDGVPASEFKAKMNILTLPYKVMELFNDKDLIAFFTYADSMEEVISSIESAGNTTVADE